MSVMGKVFEFLGFENSETEVKQKQKKEKKIRATYNFKKKKAGKVDNFDGIKVLYPEIMADAEKYVENIKAHEPVIVSIEYCQKEEEGRILAFLKGAITMANGKLETLEKGKYYVLLPEDMEIEEK